MSWVLLILALIIFIYFSYQKPLSGVVLIILLLPSYLWRFSFGVLPTTFLELMILSLFIIWLIKDKRYSKLNLFNKPSSNRLDKSIRYLLIAWLVVSLLSLLINPTIASLGLWRAYFLEPMMFFLVFIYSVNDHQDLKLVIKALGGLIVWLFILAMIQLITSWNLPAAYNLPNIKRLTSIFSYPNALSLLTAMITSFFLGLWLTTKNRKIAFYYSIIALAGFSLSLLARSDGAILAIFISLLLWLILAKKVRKWGQIIVVLTVIIIFFITPVSRQLSSLKQQLFNPVLDLQATSLEIRSSQWQETWLMLKDNFLTGAGLNGYQTTMMPYHQVKWLEVYLYPHNVFLNFWVELGFFGLIIFLGILIYLIGCLKKLFQDQNRYAWPLTLAWSTWLIHGLVDVPYFKNDLSILFFIFLGLTILVPKKTNE